MGICHQYNRRLEKQAEEQGLFEPLSDDALKSAWIEPIDHNTAKEVIEDLKLMGMTEAQLQFDISKIELSRKTSFFKLSYITKLIRLNIFR